MTKYLVILLMLLFPVRNTIADNYTPEEIVQNTTDEVLKVINAEREILQSDPIYLRKLVDDLIIPHFDFSTMSRLVLNKHWEEINELEQTCFEKGFRNMLVERYASILLSYNNHSITYDPVKSVGQKGYVSIRQTITRDSEKPLPIEYPMRPDINGWKVVDLVIDGVSLLKSYRQTFNTDINTLGVDEFVHSFPECNPEVNHDISSYHVINEFRDFYVN